MKTPIAIEILSFLATHPISARALARTAGVPAATILHITSGRRKDMRSVNADKIREAMLKLSIPTMRPGGEERSDG